VAYLLRVVLPDRPGMLGAVATALGEAGADIVGLDIVERGPDGAVDDLLVVLPPGGLADRLITSAQSVPGVVVESLRPHLGGTDLRRDLDLVEEMASAPHRATELLVKLAPDAFGGGWALLVDASAGIVTASRGAPEPGELGLPWPVPQAREVAPTEEWVPRSWALTGTQLVLAPLGEPTRAILLGRPGGPAFRSSEVVRLAHLAGLAASVESGLRR
jgi:hypothetical protein